MLYRILTERKNTKQVEGIVSKYFTGYTILKADGYWKRERENSLIIEIDTNGGGNPKTNKVKLNAIADAIKRLNQQQAVLIQAIPVDA